MTTKRTMGLGKNRVIRYNLVYRLRKKGFRVDSRGRTIFAYYLSEPYDVCQIRRLVNEFYFVVQLFF